MNNIKLQLSSKALDNHTYQLEISIENLSEEFFTGNLMIQPAFLAKPNHLQSIRVEKLESKNTQKFTLNYQINQGGCHTFYGWWEGAQLTSLTKYHIHISGKGYYSGDVHNHSTYSDGKGTLEENRESMKEKGHSFLYSTDHNTFDHREEIESYKETDQDFLHITGYEFTSKYGHALAYNTDKIYSIDNITERNNVEEWQKFVNSNPEPAFVYLAHPYEAPKYELGEDVLSNIEGITGIEVWNGFNHHALAYQNQRAFKLWDSMNLRGYKKYFGNAVSDAHTAEKQGNPFIMGQMEELSEEEVHRMLSTGAYFGSNGPEIHFNIDGQSLGETIYLESEVEYKPLQLEVFDPLGNIESIIIYKGEIDGYHRFKKTWEYYPTTENDRRHFIMDSIKPVKANEIYRVEVVASVGIASLNQDDGAYDKGFAYTNPIWVK